MADGMALKERFYPEARIGGFSHVDCSVEFYTRIASIITPNDRILDYGAGRGAQIEEDLSPYRRWLKTFKGRVAHVEGCDIDPVVLANPYLDHAAVFEPGGRLPYADGEFDLVYSNWVFEHIADPVAASHELLRVVKSGGYICAITPNKFGYIAIASRMVQNKNHAKLLKSIQPERIECDVFPAFYKLNTKSAIKKYFGDKADVVSYTLSPDPAYHFNNPLVFRSLKALNRFMPSPINTVLITFIRKK